MIKYMSIKSAKSPLKCLSIILASSIFCHAAIDSSHAQDKKSTKTIETLQSLQPNMRAASEAYQDLIGLLFDSQEFSNPQNTKRIKGNLDRLQNNFHTGDKKFSVLSEDPTALANLNALSDALKDAARRFNEGNFDYARWRLKTINLNCVTCHASNQSQLYSRQSEAPSKAPKHEQADFYLATRRFDKAKQLFAEVVVGETGGDNSEKKPDNIERLRALKGWLWIVIRHEIGLASTADASAAASKSATENLREIISKAGFAEETVQILEQWSKDLQGPESNEIISRWEKEPLSDNVAFSNFASEPRNFAQVLILMQRLTARLESLRNDTPSKGSETSKGSQKQELVKIDLPSERAQIMLKLGLLTGQSYELTWDNLPDAYLKGCIHESPNSEVSRLCFEALEDFMEREFMGPGGAQLPKDIAEELAPLKREAGLANR